jgi:hypothetical protein
LTFAGVVWSATNVFWSDSKRFMVRCVSTPNEAIETLRFLKLSRFDSSETPILFDVAAT